MSTDKVDAERYFHDKYGDLIEICTSTLRGSSGASISSKDARELANRVIALCDEIDTEEVMKQ